MAEGMKEKGGKPEVKVVNMCEDMKPPRKHDDDSYQQMLKEQEQLRKPHTK